MTEAELLSDIDPVLRRREPNMSEATSPLWVYVAGPMRGIAEFNFPAFEEATAQLRSRGYKVISPAEQDLGRGFDPSGLTGLEDLSSIGFDLREALLSDLKCVSECDAICLLPGWEDSTGATVELDLAVALGLDVRTLDAYLFDETMTEHEFLQGVYDEIHPDRACSNCDGRKCMACVFREVHDECRDDCPDCCPGGVEPTFSPIVSLAKRYTDRGMDFPGLVTSPERDNEVRITSSTGGQKGKKLTRFDLIPTGPLWAVANLYGRGASKYEDRGWERGYDWSLSYAALQRHANLFWSREDDDAETGLPHLAAVVFHALALMEYRTTHPEFDDRPGVSK